MKRLKALTPDGITQCIRETGVLNLKLYVSEMVAGVLETTYKAADVRLVAQLCSCLHKRYEVRVCVCVCVCLCVCVCVFLCLARILTLSLSHTHTLSLSLSHTLSLSLSPPTHTYSSTLTGVHRRAVGGTARRPHSCWPYFWQ